MHNPQGFGNYGWCESEGDRRQTVWPEEWGGENQGTCVPMSNSEEPPLWGKGAAPPDWPPD